MAHLDTLNSALDIGEGPTLGEDRGHWSLERPYETCRSHIE
jgi:hypothetical protein